MYSNQNEIKMKTELIVECKQARLNEKTTYYIIVDGQRVKVGENIYKNIFMKIATKREENRNNNIENI